MPRTRRQRNGAGVSSNGDDAFVANLILKPVEKMNLYEMRSLLKIMKRGGKGLAQVRRAELERRVKRLIASMKSSKGTAPHLESNTKVEELPRRQLWHAQLQRGKHHRFGRTWDPSHTVPCGRWIPGGASSQSQKTRARRC